MWILERGKKARKLREGIKKATDTWILVVFFDFGARNQGEEGNRLSLGVNALGEPMEKRQENQL